MKPRTALTILGVAVALGGCDPRLVTGPKLSPRDVQTLRGTWQGEASLTYGEKYCPTYYLWTLRVADGNIDGELVDKDTPNAPRSRFTTYLDYEGGMFVFARPNGRDTQIRGSFSRDRFTGEARNKECSYTIQLRRSDRAG